MTVNGSDIADLSLLDGSETADKKPSPSIEKENVASPKAPIVDPAIVNVRQLRVEYEKGLF